MITVAAKRGSLVICSACLALLCMLSTTAQAASGNGGYDAPYMAADHLQELSDWTSGLVNPALLYRVNQFHVGMGMYRWSMTTSEPMGFGNMSLYAPIRRNHTAGLSIVGTGIGAGNEIEIRTINAQRMIESNGLTARFYDFWAIGHYAWRLPLPWLVLGTNLKLRLQRPFAVGDQDAQWAVGMPPGVDIGVYLNPFDHYRFGDLGFSLMLQDVVPTRIESKFKDYVAESFATTRVRAGLRYSGLNDKIIGDAEMVVDNALINIMKGILGLEADTVIDGTDTLTEFTWDNVTQRLSAHFRMQMIHQVWLKFGWNNNNIPYIGFNFNVIYPLPEMINFLNVDGSLGYSFIEEFGANGGLGDERGFTFAGRVSSDFGPTREQRESKRLYDKLILAPMDAYQEAMRLYMAGKYWEASFAFGKVISLFPNFHMNDKVSWYMGDCYHKLQLNAISREVYKEALEEYTTSEMRAKYLYGLQRLDYREGRYDDALKNHAFIINLYPENEIRPDADYLAGQIYFERKNYSAAEQILNSINPGSAAYLYAQYTLSIINLDQNKTQQALTNLSNVISDSTQDVGERLLQDGSYLKMGHIFFEQGDKLRQAVEAYQRVSPGTYQDEALLGMSWAWIKVNKPEICLQTIDQLLLQYPKSALVPEAYLVKGYSLMLLRRYRDAVDALQKCLQLVKGEFVGEQELANRSREHNRAVQDFLPTSQDIKKNALRKPSSRTLEDRPTLKVAYDKFKEEGDGFFAYQLLAKSHTRFFMRKEQVISDAEYALAKATNMLKSRKATEQLIDQKEKQQDIDKQIQKLEEQLKNIE